MDENLFNSSKKINDYVKRNITSIAPNKEAFASLLDDADDLDLIHLTIQKVRSDISRKKELSDFYYTAAIEYPFKTVPFMQTRFSDGRYPVWYGSMTLETTLHETIYHAARYITSIAGIAEEGVVCRKRALYDVFCDALLIDVVSKEKDYPDLVSNDYRYTHEIGQYVKKGGYPGIVSRSARDSSGKNINIFKQSVLSNPNYLFDITYRFDFNTRIVLVDGLKTDTEFRF
jgi:hypothetical protein